MGCTKSRLDDKVCLKDKNTAMHIAYINKHGLEDYYKTMGVEDVSNHNTFKDNSSNLNLGLIILSPRVKMTLKTPILISQHMSSLR